MGSVKMLAKRASCLTILYEKLSHDYEGGVILYSSHQRNHWKHGSSLISSLIPIWRFPI